MGFFYRLTVTKTLCKPTLTRPLGSLWKDVLEGSIDLIDLIGLIALPLTEAMKSRVRFLRDLGPRLQKLFCRENDIAVNNDYISTFKLNVEWLHPTGSNPDNRNRSFKCDIFIK